MNQRKKELVSVSDLERSLENVFESNKELLNKDVIKEHLGRVGFNLGRFNQSEPPKEISHARAHDFLKEIQNSFGFEDDEIDEVKEEVGLEEAEA